MMTAAAPVVPARAPRSGQTRQLLVDTAMRLFRDGGYEKTTMRGIAVAAGVSVGNAYYYFESKDELVREFYGQLQAEHFTCSLPLLREGQSLGEHLRVILATGLDVLAPYHGFGPVFVSAAMGTNAADRGPARQASVELFREAVRRSRPLPPLAVRESLPELLWLLHRGMTLYWAYDTSPDQERTRRLIANAVPLVAKLVVLARLPVVRKIIEEVAGLVQGTKI
jgi:AcrR family transcriptional regulator